MWRNVELVRSEKYRIIRGAIPREVRKELMKAVKDGELGHFKKNGIAPEIFYHPDYQRDALDAARREIEAFARTAGKVLI